MYNWNNEFKHYKRKIHLIGSKDRVILPNSLLAIKSCIEADDPIALKDLLDDHKGAHIYALIQCFTLIPAVKCIEYLIAEGTPTDVTFEDNPNDKTAQQYFDDTFNISTNGHHLKVRKIISDAMSRGKKRQRKISYDEHTIIMIAMK